MLNKEEARHFYTYFHTRNDTGAVFYVGKGKDQRAGNSWDRSKHWKRIVARHGHTVHQAMTGLSEKEALDHEVFLISCFKTMGVKLCNATNGGEGTTGFRHSQETRAKMSTSHTGRVMSEHAKARLSIARRSIKLSVETRARIGAATSSRKGQYKHREETKDKQRAASTGRTHTEETRSKLRSITTAWHKARRDSINQLKALKV